MKFLPPHALRLSRHAICWLLFGLLAGGCAVIEPGAPVAAVNVEAHSSFEVFDEIERVFTRAGYRTSGRTFDSITFDQDGTKADRVIHGNWMGGDVAKRARVVVVEKGGGKYRIRCTPLIVRDPGDGDFEDAHRRAQLVSFHYSGLLREVRRHFR